MKFRHKLALPDLKYMGAHAATVPRRSSQEVGIVLQGMAKFVQLGLEEPI